MTANFELVDRQLDGATPKELLPKSERLKEEDSETPKAVIPVDDEPYDDERAGLLDDSTASKELSTSDAPIGWRTTLEEMKIQGRLAGPIATNLLMIGLMNNVTLSFAGHYSTEVLAAAALSGSITFMFGRLPLIGMSCALDTLASQAFGAGQIDSLAIIWQRTVAFLGVHCLGLTAIVVAIPHILPALGWDPVLCHNMAVYSLALVPSIWLDVFNRPINRILVAQKVTSPQAYISVTVLLLHVGINYLLVNVLKWGFVAVALAQSLSALNTTLLMLAYVILGGRSYCVYGKGFSLQAFKEWKLYAKIAYPACFMECAESWCWGGLSLMAGLLPHPSQTVAALSIAFSLFNNMFFVYLSQGLACSTRVGNCLGAGKAREARIAMLAARAFIPITWIVSAALFTEPHMRQLLIWLYTDGSDLELIRHIHRLLWLMVLLNLVDGTQCILTGVIQGLGRQSVGFRFNLLAFYAVGIPTAWLLGFPLHLGVEGLYCGLILGAGVQAAAFYIYTSRVDWQQEAHLASSRVQEVAAAVHPCSDAAEP